MPRQTVSALFLTTAILFAVLAAATLIPAASGDLSDLGYYALCPFAPWSTLILLFCGGICWMLHKHQP